MDRTGARPHRRRRGRRDARGDRGRGGGGAGGGATERKVKLAAVILAAGAGTRMGGRAKALLPVDQTTFLARVIETARRVGVGRQVIVLGHLASEVERTVEDADDLVVVRNPEPQRGQLSSLKI